MVYLRGLTSIFVKSWHLVEHSRYKKSWHLVEHSWWKVLSPDGWDSRVAPRGLGFDPLVGWISGLIKKILSLCLIHSRVSSPRRHPPAWAVAEWAVVVGPLVMGGQGSEVFSIGTCWFRDFLAISGLCAPWVSALGDVGEGGFPLPGRVFLLSIVDLNIYWYNLWSTLILISYITSTSLGLCLMSSLPNGERMCTKW
jgi:hypothetical protein